MTATRITATRNSGGLAAAIVLVLTLSWPAHVAAAGYEPCGAWGAMYTQGNSTDKQYHFVAPYGTTANRGSGYHQEFWGYISGTHEWDVWGVGVYSENAVCPQ